MWRAVVEAVGPFLVPFALYALWIAALKRTGRRPKGGEGAKPWPWVSLSIAGLALAFAVLILTSNRQRMDAGERYAPARMQDGVILPGGAASR